MFMVAFFIIPAQKLTQPRCPPTDTWAMTICYIYTMECYLAIKNKITKSVGKWMEPENVILSEVTQTQKEKYYYVFSLLQMLASKCVLQSI